jgi:dolichol-phosphate mannosyltransferase
MLVVAKKLLVNFVLIMDADLSHSPRYIPAMLRKQKKHSLDIVVGSRYHLGNSRCGVYGWSFGRKITSTVANCLASFVLGLPASATDVTGSFRLYKRPILVRLIEKCSTGGYAFQMEVLVRAYKHEMLIGEVPIVFVDRLYGNSKLNSREIFKYLQGVGKLFVELP